MDRGGAVIFKSGAAGTVEATLLLQERLSELPRDVAGVEGEPDGHDRDGSRWKPPRRK